MVVARLGDKVVYNGAEVQMWHTLARWLDNLSLKKGMGSYRLFRSDYSKIEYVSKIAILKYKNLHSWNMKNYISKAYAI